jgi:hypothetical protein
LENLRNEYVAVAIITTRLGSNLSAICDHA